MFEPERAVSTCGLWLFLHIYTGMARISTLREAIHWIKASLSATSIMWTRKMVDEE